MKCAQLVEALLVVELGGTLVEVEVLVGEGVHQLVDQGHLLQGAELPRASRHHHLPGVAVVEARHLLLVEVEVQLGEVHVGREQSQQHHHRLVASQLLGFQLLFDLLPHSPGQLRVADQRHRRLLEEPQLACHLRGRDQLLDLPPQPGRGVVLGGSRGEGGNRRGGGSGRRLGGLGQGAGGQSYAEQ